MASKECKYCNKPLPLTYDDLNEREEVGECDCDSSYYANLSDADRAADAEYEEYIRQSNDKSNETNN